MTMTRRTTPFAQIGSLRHAVDQLFDESAFRPIARAYSAPRNLPVDITSSDEAVTIEAALPGVRPDDVELTVHEDALTITVKDADSASTVEGERVYRELRRSHGSRTLRLPKGLDLDAANATFENGLLKLVIPRAEQAKPRQIPLSTVTESPVTSVEEAPAKVASESAEQA
ncbi:MAG: Hsp20/alpha crystallin family protein [Chloroflexota bacterium]